jgi:hypothetical protein
MGAAMAAGEAGGFDLTSLFVSIVPSFAGMGEAMKSAGSAGAEGMQEGFKENFHPFESASETIGEAKNMFAQVGGEAAGAFADGFSSLMKGQMPDLMSGFDVAENTVKEFVHGSLGEIPLLGEAFDKVFDGILGTLDAFKGPAGEFIDTLLSMGEGWQETARQIAGQTLDTGQIPQLLNIVKQLGSEGTPNLEVVSKNIAQVHARLSELDDTQLKEFMKTLAQVSELAGGAAPNVQDLTGVLNAFNIPTEQANQTLIELGNIARGAAVPLNQLVTQMSTGGAAAARSFGYDIQQLGSLVVNLNKAGLQAPQILTGMKMASSKFIKEGLTPEEGWKDFVVSVQSHFAEGTEAGTKAAEEEIRKFFPRAVPQMEEAFRKGLVTLPDATQILAGMEEPPEKALAATETLADKLKSLKSILDSALEPLEKGMADALTRVGTQVAEWFQTHQGQVLGAVKTVLDTIATWTQSALHILGESILAVAPYLNVIKSITIDIGKLILDTIGPLVKLGELVHLPGMKDANQAIGEMRNSLGQLEHTDITKYSKQLGNDLVWAANQVPKVRDGMDNLLDPMISAGNFSSALKQNITDATTGVTSLQDAFQATAEGGLKLTGNVDDTWDRLNKLGIQATVGPDGIVKKFTAANQLIAKQFEDWYKSVTGKDLKTTVEVEPHKQLTVDDMLTGAGVPNQYRGPDGIQLPFSMAMQPGAGIPGLSSALAGIGSPLPPGGMGSAGPGGKPSAGAEAWRSTVRQVLSTYGPGQGIPQSAFQAWEDAIVKQIGTESGGDPNAYNPHDPNGRGGFQVVAGLLQFVAETYAAHNISGRPYPDAIGEIAAVLSYVPKSLMGGPAPGHIGEGHGFLGGGLARFMAGQEVTGDWKPGRDSVHGVLEVGEYVTRRDMAQKNRAELDHINSGGKVIMVGKDDQDKPPGYVKSLITMAPWWLVQKGLNIPAPPNVGASPFHQSGGLIHGGFKLDEADGDYTLDKYGRRIPQHRKEGSTGLPALDWLGHLLHGMGFQKGGSVPFPQDGSPGAADYGVSPEILAVEQIARGFGLPMTSGYRDPGGPTVAGVSAAKSYHGTGEAGDFSDGDKTERELQFAAYMYSNYGRGIAELIHDDPRWSHNINDGRDVGPMGQFYTTAQAGYHGDHVHIAIKSAGRGRGVGDSGLGPPGGGALGPMPGLTGNYDIDMRNQRLANQNAEIAHNQEELRRIDDEIGKKRDILTQKQAELDRYERMTPQEQALNKTEMEKARKARDSAQSTVDSLEERKTRLQEGLDTKQREAAIRAEKPEGGRGGKGGEEGQAERLGSGFVKGVFEELGFGGAGSPFGGKPFTEWGIWKLFTGGVNYGMGLLDWIGGGKGGGGGGGGGGLGGLGGLGGGGDILSGVLGGGGQALGLTGLKTAVAIPGQMSPTAPSVHTAGLVTPGGGDTYHFYNADQQTAQANWNIHNDNKLSQSRWTGQSGPVSYV